MYWCHSSHLQILTYPYCNNVFVYACLIKCLRQFYSIYRPLQDCLSEYTNKITNVGLCTNRQKGSQKPTPCNRNIRSHTSESAIFKVCNIKCKCAIIRKCRNNISKRDIIRYGNAYSMDFIPFKYLIIYYSYLHIELIWKKYSLETKHPKFENSRLYLFVSVHER